MKSPNVPHDSFSEGFAVGYQFIRASASVFPLGQRRMAAQPHFCLV
jgi:hypothetical protein